MGWGGGSYSSVTITEIVLRICCFVVVWFGLVCFGWLGLFIGKVPGHFRMIVTRQIDALPTLV